MYLNKLFPDVVGFDAGGVREKLKSKNTDEVIGKRAKWKHTNQVCGTLTATAGESFLELKTGARKISRDKRLVICGAQDRKIIPFEDLGLLSTRQRRQHLI